MIFATIVLITVAVYMILLLKLKSVKLFLTLTIFVGIFATLGICFAKPVMHKNFSMSVIDYLIKFNTDGSVTTTKQTTTTTIKEDK